MDASHGPGTLGVLYDRGSRCIAQPEPRRSIKSAGVPKGATRLPNRSCSRLWLATITSTWWTACRPHHAELGGNPGLAPTYAHLDGVRPYRQPVPIRRPLPVHQLEPACWDRRHNDGLGCDVPCRPQAHASFRDQHIAGPPRTGTPKTTLAGNRVRSALTRSCAAFRAGSLDTRRGLWAHNGRSAPQPLQP